MFLVTFLLLTFSTISLANYNDTFARQIFSLAAGAYSEHPGVCLQNRFPKSELVEAYNVECDHWQNHCKAYVAILNDENLIALVFR